LHLFFSPSPSSSSRICFRGTNSSIKHTHTHTHTSTPIEYIWLVQNDAAVCTTNSKWCIYDFFGWDYLGAPWDQRFHSGPEYGNGGFSLRSRRLQVECLRPDYFEPHASKKQDEDLHFSYCLRDANMHFRVAPLEVARQFSGERDLMVGSFGWHHSNFQLILTLAHS